MKKDQAGSVSFRLFPDERMNKDYPWQLWLVGWVSIYKSITWLFTEPYVANYILNILLYKYLILLIPFLVLGFGIWNKKKWAAWGLSICCFAELLFFLFFTKSLNSLSIDYSTSAISFIFSFAIFLINGPISDIFILICIPAILKHIKNKDELTV